MMWLKLYYVWKMYLMLGFFIRILSTNLTPKDIMNFLDKNGYRGYIVEEAEAVLEDVFVSYAGGQNR